MYSCPVTINKKKTVTGRWTENYKFIFDKLEYMSLRVSFIRLKVLFEIHFKASIKHTFIKPTFLFLK